MKRRLLVQLQQCHDEMPARPWSCRRGKNLLLIVLYAHEDEGRV